MPLDKDLSPTGSGRRTLLPNNGVRPGLFSENHRIIKLSARHREDFEAHLLRLDIDSRRWRFATPVGDGFLRAYAARIGDGNRTLLGCMADGALRGVAELVESGFWWSRHAELAFSVEPAWRGRKIGTELFRCAVVLARNRWVTQIHLACLPGNAVMRRIAAAGHARLVYDGHQVEGLLLPEAPSPLTYWEEFLSDSGALREPQADALSGTALAVPGAVRR